MSLVILLSLSNAVRRLVEGEGVAKAAVFDGLSEGCCCLCSVVAGFEVSFSKMGLELSHK